jgi:nucleotidyltransferase/DNA polymerase involved in DNA repair
MKSELGITVSVGVSFNKIFAKLGSGSSRSG